jgi:hypothetical protein
MRSGGFPGRARVWNRRAAEAAGPLEFSLQAVRPRERDKLKLELQRINLPPSAPAKA